MAGQESAHSGDALLDALLGEDTVPATELQLGSKRTGAVDRTQEIESKKGRIEEHNQPGAAGGSVHGTTPASTCCQRRDAKGHS